MKCPYCAHQVLVPEPYRDLRDADRRMVADRADAKVLYKKVGRPVPRWLRAWGRWAETATEVLAGILGLIALTGSFAFLILVFGGEILSHAVAPLIGIDLVDRFGGGTVYLSFGVLVFGLVVLPLVANSYVAHFTALRLRVQRGLAAALPARPGGPATCRRCGAALDVPTGAFGVRCVYCHADNLVALPEGLIRRTRSAERRFHGNIRQAVAKERQLRSEARKEAQHAFVTAGVAFVILLGVGHSAVWFDNDETPPSWSEMMFPERTLVPLLDFPGDSAPRLIAHVANVILGPREASSLHVYYAALERGESLVFSTRDLNLDTSFTVRRTSTFMRDVVGDESFDSQSLRWSRTKDRLYTASYGPVAYTGLLRIELFAEGRPGAHIRWDAVRRHTR